MYLTLNSLISQTIYEPTHTQHAIYVYHNVMIMLNLYAFSPPSTPRRVSQHILSDNIKFQQHFLSAFQLCAIKIILLFRIEAAG